MPIERRALMPLRVDRVPTELASGAALRADRRAVPGERQHLLASGPEAHPLTLAALAGVLRPGFVLLVPGLQYLLLVPGLQDLLLRLGLDSEGRQAFQSLSFLRAL